MEADPENRLTKTGKQRSGEARSVDVDTGTNAGVAMASIVDGDESRRVPDGRDASEIEAMKEWAVGELVEDRDLIESELEVVAVVVCDLTRRAKLLFGGWRHFAVGKGDATHVWMIDAENDESAAGETFGEYGVFRPGPFPTVG